MQMDKPVKQLIYNKDNLTEFFPKNLIENIFNSETGENLYTYLSKFNHINVGYVSDKQQARLLVPSLFRYKGLYLTFNINDDVITQYFNGTNDDAKDESIWSSDDFWEENTNAESLIFKARVKEVTSPEIATASVVLNDKTFEFSFGLPRGLDGAPGPQGPPGDSAISTKTVFVFKTSDEKPDKPSGGSWDFDSNTITYPIGWEPSQDNLVGIIWMSFGTFSQDGSLEDDWSEPIRISGANGENGKDGTTIEFIYKLTKNDFETPTKPDNKNEDDYVPEDWTDSPTGISSENKVEWVCSRKKTNSVWQDWEGPVIWSKWGENGMDGDGVEYIYKLTNTSIPPEKPTENSEDDDFVPSEWTDNPTGVDEINQWEWVSTRKSKNGVWGEFSNPALWAKYGETGTSGNSVRTMYCKTEGSDVVPEIIKDNINPGSEWGIGIPSYSGNEAIWGIQGIVTYDNKLVGEWQGPYLITGVNGKDGTPPNYTIYVFKQSESMPTAPTSNSITPGDGWVDYPTGDGTWWMCVGTVNGVTGLVTSWGTPIRINGKDGAGAISIESIKELYGISNSSDVLPEEWYETPINPTEEFPYAWNKEVIYYSDKSSEETSSRVYAVYTKDGKGIVSITNYYKLTETIDTPNREDLDWVTEAVVPTQEKPYAWNYEDVLYSDDSHSYTNIRIIAICGQNGINGVGISKIEEFYGLSDNIDTPPNEWKTEPQVPTEELDFAWNYEKITYDNNTTSETTPRIYATYVKNGIDGISITSVKNYYKLTAIEEIPSIDDDDWSTSVLVPNETNKYLWNYEIIEYSDSNTYNTGVRLLCRYGQDGGYYQVLEELYGLSNDINIEPSEWVTTPVTPTAEERYAWLKEKVGNNEGDSKYTNARIYAFYTENGVDGVSITEIVNYYKLSNTTEDIGKTPTYSELTDSWSTEPLNVDKENPYLYNVEVVFYSNGNKTITASRIIANYSEDGNSIEFRFATGTEAPYLDNTAREPDGWGITPPSEVPSGEYVWMIVGTISPDNKLIGTWRGPTKISGEQGPQGNNGPAGPPGPSGSDGVDGIPGVTYANLYFSCNIDKNNNIDYSEEGFGIYFKTLYDTYKTDPNIYLKGTFYDEAFSSIISAENLQEAEDSVNSYKEAIKDESLDEETKNTYQSYINLYEFMLRGNGIKFVQSIDDLYYDSVVDGKKKLNPYIGFIQARVNIDTYGNYTFDGNTTQWCEPQLLQGINGIDGKTGATGNGISSITDYYKLTSTYEAPIISTSDSTTPLNPTKENPYLWVREYITYTNGNKVWSSDSARLLAKYSENGEDGVGIKSTITSYAVSDSPTEAPTVWSTTIPVAGENQYLWTKIEITYTNDEKSISYTVVKNGSSGNSIERLDEYYGLSNDENTYPSSWDINPVTPTADNKYAWNKEITVFTDGSQQENTPHIYALYLSDGVQGEPGETIVSIVNYYCASKTKKIPDIDVSNNDNIFAKTWYDNSTSGKEIILKFLLKTYPNSDYPYLYNYEMVTLSSGTTYSTPVKLVSSYTENGSGNINFYCVNNDSSNWNNLNAIAKSIFDYYKTNPNIDKITWDYIRNLSDEDKLALFKTLEDDFKQEINIDIANSIIDTYGPYIDLFSSDLTFIDGDGAIYDGSKYPIYMITANVYTASDGYKFADGTTQWSEPVRINSKNGTNGTDGTSVNSIEVQYTLSSSNTDIPNLAGYVWSTSIPTPTTETPYIWQRTRYINQQGNTITSTYILYTVAKDGISVNDIIEYYCLSSNNTTPPSSGWTTSVPTMTSVNRYLWNYEVFQMSDGSTKETSKRVIGVYGRDGEAVGGIGISSIDEYYARALTGPGSAFGNNAPSFELDEETGTPTTSTWVTSFPTNIDSSVYRYVWNVEVVTYTDGSRYISEPVCIFIYVKNGADGADGADGTPGADGKDGVGIESITNYYLRSSLTSGITISSSGWTTSVLTPTVTERYIWNYEKIVYTNGTSYTSPPHIIAGLGEDGEDGRKGQLVYPAGIYSNTTSYTTDEYKAPYVLDTSDGNFYVLNAQMTWVGTSQNNRSPAQDYTENNGKYWLKFDAFEAIYAKIGIIANGLIGSAVFNGDWMFSQYGINYNGIQNSNYENFTPSWITLTKFTSDVTFVPKYAVNLKSGVIYIHGTGSSTNIPSLTIDNGSITFCRKSYSSATNFTTKIINGNTVYHANGATINTIKLEEGTDTFNVLGWCIGNDCSVLVYSTGDGKYYKCTPYTGMFDTINNSGGYTIVVNGMIYKLGTTTVSSFTAWLNSIN